MLKIDLVMPMAGKGERVKDLAPATLKPFIKLSGTPLYQHALASLKKSFVIEDKIAVLPLNQNSIDSFKCIHTPLTRGPLESALLGVQKLTGNHPFAILDCDLAFSLLTPIHSLTSDAAIVTFKSNLDRYSYAQVEANRVTRVAEKIVISNHAIAGCYLFSNKDMFIRYAQEVLSNDSKKEFFISDLLSLYLGRDLTISAYELDEHISLGTSQEISESRYKIDSK